tara:strand:+ start:39670 stop:40350 length:681 start_codon:yes stop_codon:yes gene_type:complete
MKHMRKLNCYLASLWALALMLPSLPSHAGNIYHFLDENGVSTLSKTLPPYAAQQGYEILDDKTLRVIERVLTRTETIELHNAEQIIAKAEQLKQEQLAQLKRLEEEQQIIDQNLLDSYPSVQNLIKARDDQRAATNKQIDDTLAQQKYLQEKLHKLQLTAAEQELSGQSISGKLNKRIESTQKQIVANKLHQESLQNDNINSSQQYEHDLIRLRQLKGLNPKDVAQ